mmetsp:Transcript_24689/g.65667  ORF Transcript_24689/g.65667 Transcript_24689/m.65667 type:complete len:211 (+) Transcript_24689:602-1234(+)
MSSPHCVLLQDVQRSDNLDQAIFGSIHLTWVMVEHCDRRDDVFKATPGHGKSLLQAQLVCWSPKHVHQPITALRSFARVSSMELCFEILDNSLQALPLPALSAELFGDSFQVHPSFIVRSIVITSVRTSWCQSGCFRTPSKDNALCSISKLHRPQCFIDGAARGVQANDHDCCRSWVLEGFLQQSSEFRVSVRHMGALAIEERGYALGKC